MSWKCEGGKKVVSSRMLYPGYVLVEMDMDDYTWHVVRNTPRVTGFVGSGETPTPLSDVEVENILHRVTTSAERPKPKLVFERNVSSSLRRRNRSMYRRYIAIMR